VIAPIHLYLGQPQSVGPCEILTKHLIMKRNLSKFNQPQATVLAAIIGLIGVLIGGLIGGYFLIRAAQEPFRLASQLQLTQTAEASLAVKASEVSQPSTPLPTLTSISTPTPTSLPTPTSTDTPTPTATHTSTPTFTPTPTPTPTQTCPYQADTDAETIKRLIEAESQAVLDKDISIIQAIFAGDATIKRGDREDWMTTPITYYTSLFKDLDFIEATHYGIQPAGPGITETVAYFTSGSRITYGAPGATPTPQINFPAPPATPSTTYGSEHWTLRRNSAGCWVITEFTFNAGHIPFPP
jgi:hypothetical protein